MALNHSNSPIPVTKKDFEREVLKSELPVVIDFWAPWCAPCRAIAPLLDKMASQWAGKVRVAKINVDDETELASSFRIRSIPTLAVMRGGKVVDTMVGFGGPSALQALFEKHAAATSAQLNAASA